MKTTTTTTTRTGIRITYLKCSAPVNEQTLRPAHSAEKIHKVRIIRTVTNVAKKAELCECTVEIKEANLLLLFGLSCENCR